MDETKENNAFKLNGFFMLLVMLIEAFVSAGLIYQFIKSPSSPLIISAVILIFVFSVSCSGFLTIEPNSSKVLTFFGKYTGTIKEQGFWWVNPFSSKKKVSLRVRNFNSERLKVNDLLGNPIEIAAVIVWKVVDSAGAMFNVNDYEEFVSIQSETAIRSLCSHFAYDSLEENDSSKVDDSVTLRGSPEEIAKTLKSELEDRLLNAGVEVIEARLSHLAYAQEIAQAMLRRQQAQAIISARKKIVEGAVGMVEHALKKLSENNIVELDDERKAAMVNNLMVALVSENDASPVINTGSLY